MINVQAPLTPQPAPVDIQPTYIPPTELNSSPVRERNLDPSVPESRQRAVSQPPPANSSRKSVQFAAADDVQPIPASEATITDKPSSSRRRRRERGYEAGDDTDTPPDDAARRASRNLDPAALAAAGMDPVDTYNDKRRHHRRRRSHDPSASSSRRDRDRDPAAAGAASSRSKGKAPATDNDDGNNSDATVDLPPRFDDEGKKKSERGEDPVADRFEDIVSGKGAAGKVFGNFIDGLFGPEGRSKKR